MVIRILWSCSYRGVHTVDMWLGVAVWLVFTSTGTLGRGAVIRGLLGLTDITPNILN